VRVVDKGNEDPTSGKEATGRSSVSATLSSTRVGWRTSQKQKNTLPCRRDTGRAVLPVPTPDPREGANRCWGWLAWHGEKGDEAERLSANQHTSTLNVLLVQIFILAIFHSTRSSSLCLHIRLTFCLDFIDSVPHDKTRSFVTFCDKIRVLYPDPLLPPLALALIARRERPITCRIVQKPARPPAPPSTGLGAHPSLHHVRAITAIGDPLHA